MLNSLGLNPVMYADESTGKTPGNLPIQTLPVIIICALLHSGIGHVIHETAYLADEASCVDELLIAT